MRTDTQTSHENTPECTYRETISDDRTWVHGVCICPEVRAVEARVRAEAHQEAFATGYVAGVKDTLAAHTK